MKFLFTYYNAHVTFKFQEDKDVYVEDAFLGLMPHCDDSYFSIMFVGNSNDEKVFIGIQSPHRAGCHKTIDTL